MSETSPSGIICRGEPQSEPPKPYTFQSQYDTQHTIYSASSGIVCLWKKCPWPRLRTTYGTFYGETPEIAQQKAEKRALESRDDYDSGCPIRKLPFEQAELTLNS